MSALCQFVCHYKPPEGSPLSSTRPITLSDSVPRSDQLLQETSGADPWDRPFPVAAADRILGLSLNVDWGLWPRLLQAAKPIGLPCATVLTGGTHIDLGLIPAFKWLLLASVNCSWYLPLWMSVAITICEGFARNQLFRFAYSLWGKHGEHSLGFSRRIFDCYILIGWSWWMTDRPKPSIPCTTWAFRDTNYLLSCDYISGYRRYRDVRSRRCHWISQKIWPVTYIIYWRDTFTASLRVWQMRPIVLRGINV